MTDSNDKLITEENCRDIRVDTTLDARYNTSYLLKGKSTDQQKREKTGANATFKMAAGSGKVGVFSQSFDVVYN